MSGTETSASPSDVRKGSAFPENSPLSFSLIRGVASNQREKVNQRNFVGKAKPYRTSGGRAAPVLRIPSIQIEVVNQLHLRRDGAAISRRGLKANQLRSRNCFFRETTT